MADYLLLIGFVFVATNIDGGTLLVASRLARSSSDKDLGIAFFGAGTLIVLASAYMGSLIAFIPASLNYVGVIPLALGLWEFAKRIRKTTEGGTRSIPDGIVQPFLAFVATSFDNLIAYTTIFSRQDAKREDVGIFVLLSLYGLVAAMTVLARDRRFFIPEWKWLHWLPPIVMVYIGITAVLPG